MDAALVILDGWGLADHDRRSVEAAPSADAEGPSKHLDAVRAADTPTFDRLREAGAFGTLTAWGESVGLPDGGMGNSEVGHLTIGAGRVVKQDYTRIDEAVAAGTLGTRDPLASAFEGAAERGGRVHLVGLVSDAGVHSDHAHLHELVRLAADRGVEAVTHVFTDGRDTPPNSGLDYVSTLESVVEERGTGHVATVTGRYYAMDRDENWDRTKAAYDAIVAREADHRADSAAAAVTAAYGRGETDEFVEPTLIDGGPALATGDAVITFNFRADRMRQLVRMLANIRPEWPFATRPPDVRVTSMTEYDETFDLPTAFPSAVPEDTLGEVLADRGETQLRIAETEKYAHVTYFLNGGREVEFPGELRTIVSSPSVATYDQQPEMSAAAVTDAAIDRVESDDPTALVLNYANPDMVGHTGDFAAAVAAVEAVDRELGRLVPFLLDRGAHVLVTADHGNADDMGTPDAPHTAHTFNPVPFICLDPDGGDGGWRVRDGGGLADVAPTLLSLIGAERPAAMTGTSLLE